ncbi:MAG: hypothetical protein IKX16_02080, partial [Clostridia bacterium]|nr:hypothetical protein [Clostridia bacterium]
MLMLGISTSSKNPSVAVMEDGKILNCMVDKSGKSHSATLMTLMEKSLNAADASIKDVGCIAVDVGPGSTPINREIIDRAIEEYGIIDYANATIREVKAIAERAERESGQEFIKMEMGIP